MIAAAEDPAQAAARIFVRAAVERYCKRHLGCGRGDAEMAQHRGQVGVGLLIIDNEPGIHGHACHIHRVAMPADPLVGLEQCDIVPLAEQPGRREARNAAANNGDPEPARTGSRAGLGGKVAVHRGECSCRSRNA